MDDATTKELLDLVRDQQAQTARILEAMMAAHTAQAQVFQSWLEMFKPTATPLTATTPDERVQLREAREAEAWDAVIPEMSRQLLQIEDLSHG